MNWAMLGKVGIIFIMDLWGLESLEPRVPASSSGQMAGNAGLTPPPCLAPWVPCDWACTVLLGLPGALLWLWAQLTRGGGSGQGVESAPRTGSRFRLRPRPARACHHPCLSLEGVGRTGNPGPGSGTTVS